MTSESFIEPDISFENDNLEVPPMPELPVEERLAKLAHDIQVFEQRLSA